MPYRVVRTIAGIGTFIALFLCLALTSTAAEFRRLSIDDYRDKMAGGWIGQMAGVGWGGPTEFQWKGEIIPEDRIPKWQPGMINQFGQDDIYVEMTFLRTLEQYGFDCSIRQAGIDFANSGYPLWHANHAGRSLLRGGIAPPDSGHPTFNNHADDIDYQIEADYSGLIAPGMPNVVIELGEKFGRLMNYGDGLYGGQIPAKPTIETPLPTPGMGWSTFNYFIAMHNEKLFTQLAEAFAKSGLRDAGYTILRIDGGWWGNDGGHRHYYWTEEGQYATGLRYKPGDPHVDPKNYPNGIKPLADHLHKRGLKLGFYLDPNISMGVADNYPGNSERQVPSPVKGVELVKQHARWVADNGVDHLFFDGYAWPEEKGDKPFEVMYAELRANARRVGRPIVVSINGRQSRALADEWRTGPDIDYPWAKILECLGTVAAPGPSGKGRWANPDYLMVGFIGDQEAKSQMSLWCVAGAPLYLSHDFRVLSAWDRYVLLNTEAIAVDQDLSLIPGRCIRRDEHTQIWARQLADGTSAVVLLNAGDSPRSVGLKWSEIGLPAGPVQVRDLWAHKNVGAFEGGYTADNLPPHGCALLKVAQGDGQIPEPKPTWAKHPGKRPDFTPLKPSGWTYRTNMNNYDARLERLFDGDPKTDWSGFGKPKGFIEIKFGNLTTVDRIVIDQSIHQHSPGPNPWPYKVYAPRSRFAIEVSKDGETFQRVAEDRLGTRYTIANFAPVKVRVLRILPEVELTSAFDDTGWGARDVYLFNTGSPRQDAPGPATPGGRL